jgi:hypothetical protein
MGSSITSPYQLVMSGGGYRWTPSCWFTRNRPAYNRKADGPATDEGLAAYMEGFLDSLREGGANAHLGIESAPLRARILKNDGSGRTVAQWTRRI